MPETPGPSVKEAPESSLPAILVAPPWVREPRSKEPVVVKGLKAPQEPTTMTWAPGRREEWLNAPYGNSGWASVPDDTDWEEAAATFSSGRALSEPDFKQRRALANGLIMKAPLELGEKLLADERYWSGFCGYGVSGIMQ